MEGFLAVLGLIELGLCVISRLIKLPKTLKNELSQPFNIEMSHGFGIQ